MERKTTQWTFQAINKQNLTRENFNINKKKENLYRKTESLLIATTSIKAISTQK